MTSRENLLSLLRRTGYEHAPLDMSLCPSLEQDYRLATGVEGPLDEHFGFPVRYVADRPVPARDPDEARAHFNIPLHPETRFDIWGIAHEPGSAKAMHMTRMRHPLAGIDSLDELNAYPLPDFASADGSFQKAQAEAIHARGLASGAGMACTIWETAWYMRGMEDLMGDMMDDDPKAEWLLDAVTERSCTRAASFAAAGVDCLFLGDDIGMQHSIMMSRDMYRTWLQPRLKRVIDAARAVKPDIIVLYHSCGYVAPFIPDLMEAGIDVLNPVQPECMDFTELHAAYGEVLSFHGTLGTQTTMPFGTPDEVRAVVRKNLAIAGPKGGLWVAPTHLLEPEVPIANVLAYVDACRNRL
jgi:uroporphyrinogen decarboxylase